MLEDVFLWRKYLGFMAGSLFLSKKSKTDFHFTRKVDWQECVFQTAGDLWFAPVLNQFTFCSQKPFQPHILPHTQKSLGRTLSPMPLPMPGGDASACTAWLTLATIQQSWITPCRFICQHEKLGKNILQEVSGAAEPLFGSNAVKRTFPELSRPAAMQRMRASAVGTCLSSCDISSPPRCTQPSGGHSDLWPPGGKSASRYIYIVCLSCVPQPWIWVQFL